MREELNATKRLIVRRNAGRSYEEDVDLLGHLSLAFFSAADRT